MLGFPAELSATRKFSSDEMIEKYRQIDAEVYGELRAKEIAVFGEAVAPN